MYPQPEMLHVGAENISKRLGGLFAADSIYQMRCRHELPFRVFQVGRKLVAKESELNRYMNELDRRAK